MYDYDYSDALSAYSGYDPYSTLYSAPYTTTQQEASLLKTIVGMGVLFWIISLAVIILTFVGEWKAFKKAGHKGYECLIGGHEMFVRLTDGGINGACFFLFLIPFVNIAILIWMNIAYAKAFGKGALFGIGLLLLPCIFFPILGLGKAEYIGSNSVAKE